MNAQAQAETLNNIDNFTSFKEKLSETGVFPLKASGIEILQINTGKRCNLQCKHCHVEAGPDRREQMGLKTMEQCVKVIRAHKNITTVDITGGAPEMNENLEWLITAVAKMNRRIIVRSNLVILLEEEYSRFVDIYADNKVEIVGSLPDYIMEKSDRQRGTDTFSGSIRVLQLLNRKGYGKHGTGLVLGLVHNPSGAYMPGSQKSLESEYRRRLKDTYGVEFNNLYCITNMPLGRYLDYLMRSDNFNDYLTELNTNYNPAAVPNVMCRTTISVGWDGKLYDCDFNQMLELPVSDRKHDHISTFTEDSLRNRDIIISNHCYGCTAGAGSSCQGCIE